MLVVSEAGVVSSNCITVSFCFLMTFCHKCVACFSGFTWIIVRVLSECDVDMFNEHDLHWYNGCLGLGIQWKRIESWAPEHGIHCPSLVLSSYFNLLNVAFITTISAEMLILDQSN